MLEDKDWTDSILWNVPSSISIEPFLHIVVTMFFPIKMCGVGEASKEENKSWEEAIWCEAPESSNHLEENGVVVLDSAWPFPMSLPLE